MLTGGLLVLWARLGRYSSISEGKEKKEARVGIFLAFSGIYHVVRFHSLGQGTVWVSILELWPDTGRPATMPGEEVPHHGKAAILFEVVFRLRNIDEARLHG